MDFLFEDAQRIPDMSFSELFPEYQAEQELYLKKIAEAAREDDAVGEERNEPLHICSEFCWPCISPKNNICGAEHEPTKQPDHSCRDFCFPCKASQYQETITGLLDQYAFEKKPVLQKHTESTKKPRWATLADSDGGGEDEGGGPSFIPYIGGGQNVSWYDEQWRPETAVQAQPKPRVKQIVGITLNRRNKPNQKTVKNIIELD
jgi:hypothetical protein